MGYELHITRKEHWWDPEGPEISMAEWLALVAADPEMRLDGYAEARLDNGHVLRTEQEGLSVWTAYSEHGRGGNMAWFAYWRGEITVKNPDDEIIRKTWLVAQFLSAKVQGDDGETYDAAANPIPAEVNLPAKSWWKFW
jgi:hypothetical protein